MSKGRNGPPRPPGWERRKRKRRTVVIDPHHFPELLAALLAKGWTIYPPGAEDAAAASLLVLDGSDLPRSGESWVDEDQCLAVIAASSDPERVLAAAMTPYLYDRTLPPESLVSMLTFAVEIWGRSRRRQTPARRALLVVDLGVSVELDGVPLPLRVGARNFLFALARHDGEIIGKDARVEAGSRSVIARQCRRDLGRGLGPATAALLVPEGRNEPYRLRTSVELDAMAAPIHLIIKGRPSGPHLTYRPDRDDY